VTNVGLDESPCPHEHDLDQCGPGYRAPAARWWYVAEEVTAFRARKDWGRTEGVRVAAGTHLRLDQTDFTLGTANDWGDAWIDQRFLVLDGPLAGECVAFVADEPGLDLSWVPDALRPNDAVE
jgi:hypothetical protein